MRRRVPFRRWGVIGAVVAALVVGFVARAANAVSGENLSPLAVIEAFESVLADVAERSRLAVVTISAEQVDSPARIGRFPFEEAVPFTSGAGFFFREDGYLLTNDHVVHGASSIKVTLHDGRELPARIVGTDPNTDLAVLKVDLDEPTPMLPFGDSDALRVGQFVLTVGNPFGLDFSVNLGIVSAKGRGNIIRSDPDRDELIRYQDFIQTDAYLNLGNSGGPLVNLHGEAVGVSSMIRTDTTGDYSGIGFAIPINIAKTVAEQLVERGRVVRGWLGVRMVGRDGGILIRQVMAGSPAEKAGLRPGDLITMFDGKPIDGPAEQKARLFAWIIATTPVGKRVPVVVQRGMETVTLELELGEMPPKYTGQEELYRPMLSKLGLKLEPFPSEYAEAHGYSSEDRGLLVRNTPQWSLAYALGIRPGHLISEVNGKEVRTPEECEAAIQAALKRDDPKLVFGVRTPQGPRRIEVPDETLRELRTTLRP